MWEVCFVRSPDRSLPWFFLAAFTAATVTQGIGAKLVLRLFDGTLPAAALPALALLVAAYGLLVIGLIRMLRRDLAVAGSPRTEPKP